MVYQDFLRDMWARSTGDYVFLPRMRNGVWTEGAAYTTEAALNELAYSDQLPGTDYYFTPLTYTGVSRRKGMLGRPGVIYADLDGDHMTEPELPPTAIVTTSAGHAHAYWFLNAPADPIEWEAHAKGWSYKIGADPGGWDATQVLRVPGTFNHKGEMAVPVTLTAYRPHLVYSLQDFPREYVHTGSVAQPEPIPSQSERDYLIKAGIEDDRLPLSARYWLTVTPAQVAALGRIDRSKVMWQVEKALFSAGYTVYEVFHLMYFAGINKFWGRADRLWYEVNKAAGN